MSPLWYTVDFEMAKHARPKGPSLDTIAKPRHSRRRIIITRIVVIILAILLVGVGSAFGYVKFLEGKMQPKGLMARAIAAVISKPVPKEPLNFLVMGADADAADPVGRADTIMLIHVDFDKRKAVMVSIPRDFRVDIPGNGTDKINHSYHFGGPALAIKTVQQYTGLPIHHYAVVDYNGFMKLVDAIGGVDVNVKERMVDSELGDPIDKGPQHMDGLTALHYVRFRNTARGDFTRIEDQQNFARALIDQSAKIQNTFKLPTLIKIGSENVQTDMSISEMLSYANDIRSFKQDDLTTVTLPGAGETINDVSYVIPDQDKVDTILDFIKKNQPINPLLLEDVSPGDVNVKVLNGSGIEGIGGEAADMLSNKGYQIVTIGNADRPDYATSIIYYAKVNYGKALKLKSDLKNDLPDVKLTESSSLDPSVHLILIVGKDYK